MNKFLQIILKRNMRRVAFLIFALFYLVISFFAPASAFAEGNPFVPTTDTMNTGLTPRIGGEDLSVAAQTLANMTDITGAYYDSTLKRIVFVGKTDGNSPQFNKDDMAVAIKAIFFNKTLPNVSIDDDPNNPSGPTALVTYAGNIQNTNLGNVLFNADYKLKQYVVGYDPNQAQITSSVPSYQSVVSRYVALNPNPILGNQSKFILSPQTVSLKTATPENSFVFDTVSMRVISQATNPNNDSAWNQAASNFANDLTTNYSQYAQETTYLAQTKQLEKIVAVLKWISEYSIPTDLNWARDYMPQAISTPTTVQKIATPAYPNGYSAQGEINYNTPNTYLPDDGTAANLKSSAQSGSGSNEDVTWTFTNGGQQYQAVAVAATAFNSLGAFSTSAVDFSIPIAGDLGLSFVRNYSSFDNGQSGIGLGWDMMPSRIYPNSTLQDLDIVTCNSALYFRKLAIDTSNGHETFTFNCPNGYSPDDPSFHSKLVQNVDESMTVTLSDQTKYLFNVDFQLTGVQDKNSNKVNYTYDGSGKLTTIADTKSHQLTLAYNGQSLISSVTDWASRKVEYFYDSNGKLTGVKDPNGNTTTYGYDNNAKLATVSDRNGQVVLTNTYGSDARIITQKNAANITKTNTYNNVNKLITQTDTNGRVVKTTYDAKARILQQTDPLNKSITYAYGTEAVPLTQKDKNGNTIAFAYDTRGNVISVVFPDTKKITYQYDTNNRVTKTTDERYGTPGKDTTNTYDGAGNLMQINEAGLITKYAYDTTGETLTFTDPLNHLTTWTRDTLGNKLTEKDATNNIITFDYDTVGRLKKATDADGKQVSQTYDNNGNILTTTDAAGMTSSVYDKENRLTTTTLPNNSTTQYLYNSSGSMTSVLNALNSKTSYGYDNYQNLVSQTDALNNTTANIYDSLNRQTQSTTPLGKVSKWEYDSNGNITKRIDANNKTTLYQYDFFNRLTKITYPDLKTITYQFDNRDNLTQMVDLVGTSTYVYDNFDRLIQATNSYGKITKYQYDNVNNLTTIIYPDNKIVTYTYDNNDRMLSVLDWNNKTTTYTYNKNGTVATRTYPNTISTTYTYDNTNRLSGIEHKKGITTAAKFVYLRDSVGNIIQMTPSGSFFSIPKPTTYTYDALGRLLNHTSDDREGTLDYTYDKAGNMLTKKGFSTNKTYTFDADNRLTTLKDPTFGTFPYAYDNNGNVITKRDVNLTQPFTYDFDNRMISYRSGTNIKYDGLGYRISLLNQFAVTRRYVTDFSANLPQTIAETDINNSLKAWYVYGLGIISEWNNYSSFNDTKYYLEDGRGNIRFLTSYNGTTTSLNVYDGYGNISWHSGGNPAFKFGEQKFDDDTGLYYLRARYYDPTTGRFITKDPVDGILTVPQTQNPYTYAGDNPINRSDPSGKFWDIVWEDYGLPLIERFGGYLRYIRLATNPGFTSKAKLLDHFNRHGEDLGYKNLNDYIKGAQDFFKGGRNVLTFIRANGDKLFYNPTTNEFGILGKDNIIKTYFAPEKGLDYWKTQIK